MVAARRADVSGPFAVLIPPPHVVLAVLGLHEGEEVAQFVQPLALRGPVVPTMVSPYSAAAVPGRSRATRLRMICAQPPGLSR